MKIIRPLLRVLGHQEYLRFGVRDRIIRFFHSPDKKQEERFETHFFGSIYPGNFNTFLDWSVYYYGAYAKEELLLMRDFLHPIKGAVVVDVGANVGHHSLFASTMANHVHSFEPFPLVYEKLKEKIRINSITNISLHEIGLGNSKESKNYYPPSTNNTGTGSFVSGSHSVDCISLRIEKADDYFDEHGINKMDYLKIDVEGFELEVLTGMRNVLEKTRPICFLEWTQASRGSEHKNGMNLFPDDYSFYRLVDNEPVLIFFKKRNYHLTKLGSSWPDGNLLVVPKEYVEQVNALNPLPVAAHRLRGE